MGGDAFVGRRWACLARGSGAEDRGRKPEGKPEDVIEMPKQAQTPPQRQKVRDWENWDWHTSAEAVKPAPHKRSEGDEQMDAKAMEGDYQQHGWRASAPLLGDLAGPANRLYAHSPLPGAAF